MKNKKVVQIEARKKNRELLKAQRRKGPKLGRNVPSEVEKPTILIVCEGKNTEPSYFRQFKLSSADVKPIGEGYNTLSLVERAKVLSERRNYDQTWCVFDADPKPDDPKQLQNFNEAIKLAEKYEFGIAYSHQAFEYWLILHFDDHQGGAMNRSAYKAKINKLIKPFHCFYDGTKSKIITDHFFELLDGIDEKTGQARKDLAIKRAKRNYDLLEHVDPASEESSTTVFRLVEELIKYV